MNRRAVCILVLPALAMPAAAQVPSTQPATSPDLCMGPIDPYLGGAERARFFQAAGVDNELDAKEFAADAARAQGFVRPFDKWDAMLKFDKTANGTIDWFEADAYRQDVLRRVIAAFDSDKDGRLTGAERQAANAALAAGKVPGSPLPQSGPGGGFLQSGGGPDAQAGAEATSQPASQPAVMRWAGVYVQRMVRQYDRDGDGRLNDEEMRAMREDRMADVRERMREMELRHFDADGDGQLNEQEQAQLKEMQQRLQNFGRTMRDRMFDRDGDGTITDEERSAAMSDGVITMQLIGERMRAMIDADGDGHVSALEREAWTRRMRDGMQRKIGELISRHDADGDGKLSAEERTGLLDGLRDEYEARIRAYSTKGTGWLSPEQWADLVTDWAEELATPEEPTEP